MVPGRQCPRPLPPGASASGVLRSPKSLLVERRSGIAGAGVLLYIATPVGVWLVQQAGLPGFEAGLSRLRGLPEVVLLSGALTAGVVEEFLYRGYAIERLTSLTGSCIVAAAVELAAFSLAHWPFGEAPLRCSRWFLAHFLRGSIFGGATSSQTCSPTLSRPWSNSWAWPAPRVNKCHVPNPSIERTSSGRLRQPTAAAHVDS